ncbi:hypothetical protein AB0J71_19520 [Nonomuraea sp. NPDC049637]|uniref:hypothetical protein n=1 Tax=Nonomuraea sp. NPDC049637 TaxID=3154356 RepID=UPI0034496E92
MSAFLEWLHPYMLGSTVATWSSLLVPGLLDALLLWWLLGRRGGLGACRWRRYAFSCCSLVRRLKR